MSCKMIDDIFKYLEELENQRYLNVNAENQMQTLKFELRYVRMHLKWHTTLYPPLLSSMRTWLEGVEMYLLQPTTRSMAASLSEQTLSSLLLIMKVGKAILRRQCSLYYEDEQNGLNFSCKDVQIDELVLECIDPLLENFKHLIRCNDLNLRVFPKEQIEAIREKLRSLRSLLEIIGREVEDVLDNVAPKKGLLKEKSDLLTRIKRLIENAIYASCYSWAKGNEKRMEELFFDMRVKINHIEPEVRLTYAHLLKDSKVPNPRTLGIDLQGLAELDSLLDNLQMLLKDENAGSMKLLDVHQMEFLHQEMSFIKYFLLDPHLKQYSRVEPQDFSSLFMQVEAMAREGALLPHLMYYRDTKDEMSEDMNILCYNLLKKVNLFKAEIKEIYLRVPKPSISDFPKIPKLGFLEFFLQKLEELLEQGVDSVIYVKKEIVMLQNEFGLLRYFTSDPIRKPRKEGTTMEERIKEQEREEKKEEIVKSIVDVAYEAEHVIDIISSRNHPCWYHVLWLSDVITKINILKKDSVEVFNQNTRNDTVLNVEKASITDSAQAYSLVAEEVVVGLEDEAELIVDQLIESMKQLHILCITGMGGQGKTTLSKKVYEHSSVTRYFDVRSWYCISQVYDRCELFLSILGDVSEISEEIREMDDKEMAEALHKSLQGRRYLIVLDDIWSIEHWNDIRNSFPDDCNGSRIIFTSRSPDIGFRSNPTCVIHHLRFLTSHESWELLQNKVFNGRDCPPELYEIGMQIVEYCVGLPLSLVLVAGVLRLEETEDHWRQVLRRMGRGKDINDALNLSYSYLPDHLKPCFVYLGAFPEDKEIPTWKLMCLWIAEGFIQQQKSESLERVAEGYLMDLIGRGLLLIGQKKSNGGVKFCGVHDILLEFSSRKAKDENFLVISHEMVKLEQYRHFFYCKRSLGCMPSDSYTRSLIFFPTEKRSLSLISNIFYNLNSFDLSVIPYILKLLRVLDLEHVRLGSSKFPTDIELLVHLRYLAVQGRLKNVSSSISNLWRLETFRVVGTGGQVKLPGTLLEMAYLKHVYVCDEATFEFSDSFEPERSFESEGIEKLSTVTLRHGDHTTEKVIRSLRSVRKLKCIFLESSNCGTICSQFPALDLLNKLESLNLNYQGSVKVKHPCDLGFPSNLRKITLSNFCLCWSEISKIGRLPQLEVLKLLSRAFSGRRWDVSDDEFRNLKFLKLESLDIMEWDASRLGFPCLEQLVLKKCWRLEKIPSSFGLSTTLKMIQAQWCGDSAIQGVNEVVAMQSDLGNRGLKMFIQH